MKKIVYRVENRKIWKEIYDTDLKLSLGQICVFTGRNVQECKNWLIERGLK